MPKKTRQEKIIADLRRKLETVKITDKAVIEKKEPSSSLPSSANYPLTGPKHLENNSTSYVLKDLRKTFLLAGLAISFEIIVYWLWH